MVLLAVIAGLPSFIAAMTSAIVTIRNSRRIREVSNTVDAVQKATNGMKDELIKVTRSDAHQAGHSEGVADQKLATAENLLATAVLPPAKIPDSLVVDKVEVVADKVEVHPKPPL